MIKLLSVGLSIAFLPVLAIAQSDFEGEWKVHLTKSAMSDKPDIFFATIDSDRTFTRLWQIAGASGVRRAVAPNLK